MSITTESSQANRAMFPQELKKYVAAGAISGPDLEAAKLLVEMAIRSGGASPGLWAWIAMCLALGSVRDGHTCIDLDQIEAWQPDRAEGQEDLTWPPSAAPWIEQLKAAPLLFNQPGERTPFILDGRRIYLARALKEEQDIAEMILARLSTRTLKILLGGPGTGKTTKIADLLIERFEQAARENQPFPRLALAAPTGKAAARMTEAVRQAIRRREQQPSPTVKDALLSVTAGTIHRLLDYRPYRNQPFGWNRENHLPFDLVIIDESSMLSANLTYHLLSAIAPEAQVQIVGDPDQLASVDAGTVLGDLAAGLSDFASKPGQIETLNKIHRTESVEIINLAAAIRQGKTDEGLQFLRNFSRPDGAAAEMNPSITWIDPANQSQLATLHQEVLEKARAVQHAARSDPEKALATKVELQVLCAHRSGTEGVAGWNKKIDQLLGVSPGDVWYTGRPILVNRNNPALKLFNGDVGIVTVDSNSQIAIFPTNEGTAKLPVSRLEDISTVHALTIHKSQGSEYDHAIVVLPEKPSRIVTRELLYTAVTRAKKRVTVVGPEEVIMKAIETPIRRATGLAGRLKTQAHNIQRS